jgi:hypothetical protein
MKKLNPLLIVVVAMTTVFLTSCPQTPTVKLPPVGVYLTGNASMFPAIEAAGMLKRVPNENIAVTENGGDPNARIYEIYSYLTVGTFELRVVDESKVHIWGGTRDETRQTEGDDAISLKDVAYYIPNRDGHITVAKDGFYHIAYSPDANVITVVEAIFGTRGIGGDWSFSEFEEFNSEEEVIFTKTDVHVPTGNFKISVSGGWKIGLVTGNTADHGDGDPIMINTNFGGTVTFSGNVGIFNLESGGKEFTVPAVNRGIYDFEIKWTKTDGLSAKMTKTADLAPLVSNVYISGPFANWVFDHERTITMIPVNAVENVFWAMNWFEPTSETDHRAFNFSTSRNITDRFGVYGSADAEGIYQKGTVDVNIATAGYYMIMVDLDNEKVFVGEPSVYLIGSAGKDGEWTMNIPENKFDVSTTAGLSITTLSSGDQLRMYAICPLAPAVVHNNGWWRMEFIIRDEKIDYRGNGNDQYPRIPITAGKLVTLRPEFGGVSSIQP